MEVHGEQYSCASNMLRSLIWLHKEHKDIRSS